MLKWEGTEPNFLASQTMSKRALSTRPEVMALLEQFPLSRHHHLRSEAELKKYTNSQRDVPAGHRIKFVGTK
jgi:hypothetical protein